MTPSTLTQHELPADRYHAGVRLVAIGLWVIIVIALYGLGYLLLRLLLGDAAWSVLILVVLILFVSPPIARWGEQQLVRVWPSGRAVRLEPGALVMLEKSGPVRFDWRAGKVNFWRWHFMVRNRRGGRINNGDSVCALRLVQGEQAVSLYTFLEKKKAPGLLGRYPFYELQRPADDKKLPLGGRDGVYLAAEHARWDSGAELDPADFETVLNHLADGLPEFRTASAS